MQHRLLRQHIIENARRMNEVGLNQGTSGNLSVRVRDRILITPSGIPYETMTEQDIVEMTLDGRVLGFGKPSSEWLFHRDILRAREDFGAVVHAHPRYATALACLRREIPAFHYMVAIAGGSSIRCAPYATFGTQELSDHVLDALVDRRACLLANHGIVAADEDLTKALDLAIEVEALAAQYCQALAIGEPHLLAPEEMDVVLRRFTTYRQGAESARRRAS